VCTHVSFPEEVDISDGDECGMHVDMDAASEEHSSVGEQAEEGEFDTVTMTDFCADAERYDDKIDFTEEEETMKKIKGRQ
jgi:hypothetical protein